MGVTIEPGPLARKTVPELVETQRLEGTSPPPGVKARTVLREYVVHDGVPTFRNSELIALFQRAKDERLFPLVFYSVDPNVPADAILPMFRASSGRRLFVIHHHDRLAGWVWLDDFANTTARGHFCFLRWISKERRSLDLGRDVVRGLLQCRNRHGDELRVIRAEIPAFNRPGIAFLKGIGMQEVGRIPGAALRFSSKAYYPMVYLFLTKAMLT